MRRVSTIIIVFVRTAPPILSVQNLFQSASFMHSRSIHFVPLNIIFVIMFSENIIMATESGFSKVLETVGLKPNYWLAIFEKLEIDSVEALEFIDKESDEYSELIKSARKNWEKKALKKLLKIEDRGEEGKAEKEKEKTRELVRKRQEKSSQMLKELKELNQEGKQRHDERVKKIENDIREQFHISPDSWISKDKSLQDLICKLEEHQER